jgi:hypothetical protein
MTRDEAKRCVSLTFLYHFTYDKDKQDMILLGGQLNDAVCDIQDRLDTLLDKIYTDFNESQEGLRYTYEETITGILTGAEDA